MTKAFNTIVNTLDSSISNAIDKMEEQSQLHETDLTDEEFEILKDYIDTLEGIRGEINQD